MTQSRRVILSMVVAVLVLSQSPARVRADEGCAELYAVLRSSTGDALVQAVRRGDLGCLRFLERVPDRPLQIAVSLESNVLTVANSIPEAMTDYDASQNTGVEQLFLYLRMAVDIHFWCLTRRSCDGDEWNNAEGYSIDVGSPVHTAVKAAIDSFVHHPLFRYAGSEHADNLYEVGRTIIDYAMSGLYLSMVEGWLHAWDDNYAAIPAFPRAMLTVMDVVRLGHVQSGFGAVVGENRGLVHAFRDFALAERWLGTSSQWIMERSVNELGRYFKYKNTTNYDYVLPIAQSVLTTYRNRPETKALFLRMVAEIDYNDGGNCGRYGLCDWYAGEGFKANFRAALFTDTMVCPVNACSGDSMTIHAQDLELDILATGCRRLYEVGQAFQSLFDTQCTPVPGDLNSHLDIYVFDDKSDCRDMESGAFGISADTCSGIYYENDPSDPNTSAEMVAVEYEDAEYAPDPELPIRNFEHEYAHHLDGRFNTRGLYRWDDDSIHWWTEGFAEYLAAEVSPYIGLPRCESPYSLTETLLHSDSIPTRYHHRHLAVRFLMEHHRDFVDTLLEYMRRGEYTAYTAHMAAEAPKLEEEWQVWKSSCQAADDFRIYPYCSSGPRYDEFAYIARVVLGSLDHVDDVNHGHRFHDDTVTVQAGSTVELCVTTSTEVPVMDDINRVEAWIDWGGDGVFDESTEQVMNSEVRLTNRDNPVTVCANVTVPTDAYIGRVRLRVRTQYKMLSGEGQGVCENYQSGETQDYDIVVTGDPNPLDFPHFANGGGITSEVVLLNAGDTAVRPVLYFSDRQGKPLDAGSLVDVTDGLEVQPDDGGLRVRTAIEPLGELTVATHGRGAEVSGSVRVVAEGAPLGGVLRYGVPGVGVTGVGAGRPVRDALFPARRQQGGIRTAAALHNSGEEAIEVSCALMSGGAVLEEAEIPLEPNGQASWFLEDEFTMADTTDFAGTVRCRAPREERFTGLVVEVDRVNRIFTTLPLVEVERTAGEGAETVLHFAHFANGGHADGEGIRSELVFVNVETRPIGRGSTPLHPTVRESRPAVYFYDTQGEPIDPESLVDVTDPLEVSEDGALTIGAAMAPLGELTVATHGRGEEVSGSVKVVSEGPIGGVLRYRVPGVGVTGVGSGRPVRDALFPVRRREGGIRTAAAMRNLGEEAIELSCQLMSGGAVLEEAQVPLAGNGQASWFIEEAFPESDTTDFTGSVRCTAPGEGSFTGLAVEVDGANRIFTTLPVVPLEAGMSRQ